MARSPDIVMSDSPEPPEVLAAAILRISDGFDALLKSGLNRNAVAVLLVHATRVSRRDVDKILDAIKNMKRDYCR
jgi:hypothetical protein